MSTLSYLLCDTGPELNFSGFPWPVWEQGQSQQTVVRTTFADETTVTLAFSAKLSTGQQSALALVSR